MQHRSTAAALLAACDQVVVRALERADSRLRNAVGRKDHSHEAAQCDDLPPRRCVADVSAYASFDTLLEGAWAQVPIVANRYGIDADALRSVLDAYCRSLLAANLEHDFDRLTSVLLDGARAHQEALRSPLLVHHG
jgi:NAD(P)-dependent dehydrogenase (short-subunit alcohol dehydrogenase family)